MGDVDWWNLTGYGASLLVFCAFYMKAMVPLRAIAIGSNVAFIVYGLGGGLYPVLVLHAVLLPLNCLRLVQIRRVIRRVRAGFQGQLGAEPLIPLMTRHTLKAGDVLFRMGDPLDLHDSVGDRPRGRGRGAPRSGLAHRRSRRVRAGPASNGHRRLRERRGDRIDQRREAASALCREPQLRPLPDATRCPADAGRRAAPNGLGRSVSSRASVVSLGPRSRPVVCGVPVSRRPAWPVRRPAS